MPKYYTQSEIYARIVVMKSIFTDDFPLIKTDQELQTLIKQYSDYDVYYVASGAIKERHDWFNFLYEKYYLYADSNFLSDLKKHFHQRTWEMYFGCVVLNLGIKLLSHKDNGPDLSFEYNSKKVWIECVACEKGDGADKVPMMNYGVVESVPSDQMILRITSVLREKRSKYEKYLNEGIVKKDNPFIIAINGGVFGRPDGYIPLILRSLFAVGYPTISMSADGKQTKHSISIIPHIEKKNMSKVSTTFFLEKENDCISSVIYDNNLVINHSDILGKDIKIVHNAIARNHLPIDLFNSLKCYKVDERGGISL